MKELIRKRIELLYKVFKRSKRLGRFSAVAEALDEFYFGTNKVTTSPHIVDYLDVKRFMSVVIVALIPCVAASVYFWGLRVLSVILVSYMAGGAVEVLFAAARKKQIHEGFLVTGMIFPLTLPPTIPLWMVAVGSAFGVMFGKEVFGGTGRNIFNPAITGRIFLSIAFASHLSSYWQEPFRSGLGGFINYRLDAITSATPLMAFKGQGVMSSINDLLLGKTAGCIGETFRLGIILGGLFLVFTKIVNWRIPVSYIGSAILFSVLGHIFFPDKVAPWPFQVFSGGLLLGAFFMATDPVTSPFTQGGKWTAGVLLGFLTVLIRGFSGYVEGVMFAILLMNVFSPLIDHIVLTLRYRKPSP